MKVDYLLHGSLPHGLWLLCTEPTGNQWLIYGKLLVVLNRSSYDRECEPLRHKDADGINNSIKLNSVKQHTQYFNAYSLDLNIKYCINSSKASKWRTTVQYLSVQISAVLDVTWVSCDSLRTLAWISLQLFNYYIQSHTSGIITSFNWVSSSIKVMKHVKF